MAFAVAVVHAVAAHGALVDGGGRAVEAVLPVQLPLLGHLLGLWFAVLLFPVDVIHAVHWNDF